MKIPFVDLRSQYLSIKEEIDNAISSVIADTAFIGGAYNRKFEALFAELIGVRHCIGVANGTDGIYITLKMLGIGDGDEVITVANSWISTSETISLTGAKPVFADIESDYYTIDPDDIQRKITNRTKAVIPVHLYGQSANMDRIMEIVTKNNLHLIEDCAQAHLTDYKHQKVGTFGVASTFSFYPGKNLGAYGDAGCILTNDDSLAREVRTFANHGALVKHNHVIEGINSRLDGLQASILSAKLPYLNEWTKQRNENAEHYSKLLLNNSNVIVPAVRDNSRHSFHLYVIRARKRDELRRFLSERGIETLIHYPSILPLLPAYSRLGHTESDFPIASSFQKEILSLPLYPELTYEQIKYVTDSVNEFYSDSE
jgi:dTDP-4-amino-4,6-dideoxygalactose transaminase